jgi:hypothetical protein
MSLLQMAEWLEATSAGVMVRESAWGFPVLVAIHLLGLSLSAGLLVWFDLRLLGYSMPRVPASTVYRQLMPWILAGFVVMFVSGGLLLAGFATSAYGNTYFRLKAAAIVLAGINAAVYHLVTERHIARWDAGVRPAGPARLAGLTSIVLWALVILAGRMMSYTMF